MEVIKLSDTLTVSRIVHGHWRLLDWNLSPQELLTLTQNAIDLGITTFDHADIYGNYTCEQAFGNALALQKSLRNKIKNVTVEGNVVKQNRISELEGKDTYCELYLKNFSNSLLNTFTISGKIENRSVNVQSDGILQSTLAITQRIAPLRNTL